MEDSSNPKDLDRRKFLEEVRRKAEEAELKRLEEEERRIATKQPSAPSPATPPKEDLALEQKMSELLGRLSIALDRGKVDRATEVLDELSKISKNESELEEFRQRIEALRAEQERAAASEQSAEEYIIEEDRRRRIVDLLEEAGKAYQYEQYDRGLELIREILSIDPGNTSATDLRKRIEASQRLSEQIKEEEAKRKAEEETLFAPQRSEPPLVPPSNDADAWGPVHVSPAEEEVFGPGEAGTRSTPPGPNLGQRVMDVVSGIHVSPRFIIRLVAIVVVAAAAYLVVSHIQNTVPLPEYSVLILPASSASPDSESGHIASGFTIDLTNVLSSTRDVRVIAFSTAKTLTGLHSSPVQLARSVGANYVLQWSLSNLQDGVSIQLVLSDTMTQEPLLSSQYQNSLRELPAVRVEIARALLEKMGIHAEKQGRELSKAPSTSVPEAYTAYLKGRSLQQQPDSASLALALASLKAACHADTNFAEAYTGLAWTRVCMFEQRVDTSRQGIEQALTSVRHAEALGSATSELLRVIGMIDKYTTSYGRAQVELERAVEESPSDAESQRCLSLVYAARNRPDDALRAARRAVSDDPRNAASFSTLGMILQWKGEFTDALNAYEQGMQLSPDPAGYASERYADMLVYTQRSDRAIDVLSNRVAGARQSYREYYKLGRVYQLVGRPKQEWQRSLSRAEELLAERLSTNPDDPILLTYHALVQTRLGQYKDATAALSRALHLGAQSPEVLYNVARIYAVRREKQQTLEYLSKALDGWFSLPSVLDMDFYSLRSDPDFLRTITRQ